ncbi:MAG TPA: allantoinase AllB [Thermoanaerobaculia bacterium]|nr:allantoinase AllB [Thermoanaerobaculia bacterium]
MYEYILRSRRVILPDGTRPAGVHVRGGRIAAIFEDPSPLPEGVPVTDAGDSAVMAGVVDTHVHLNDPGRSDWEGFETATHAAAAGGVTTLLDMPLNSIPPTTDRHALDKKGEAAAGRIRVDVGFWGGLVPQNVGELTPLKAAGVFGYKVFLCPSGVPEFPQVTDHDLILATERLGEVPLLVHAESPGHLRPWHGPREKYSSYLASRPEAAETDAVSRMVRLSMVSRTPVHILHLSSARSLEIIARAKSEGTRVTAETCPHYLVFSSEEIADGATEFKCAPPIRDEENREKLWQGLADGTIDMVVSDHSPSPPESKKKETGDFQAAWGGISSLGLTLSATWTAARRRGFGLDHIARWMCSAPAKLAGLTPWKGTIAPGRNADFVVWDPDEEWTVDPKRLHVRHKLTPWAGRVLQGVVETTYLKGRRIYQRGEFLSTPRGEILLSA